jgi:signal transduction histidine kinase
MAAGAEHVVITVGDNGHGIPADVLPRVFEMFTTGSEDTQRGLGVGLAVARHLVDLHGGRIEISSEGAGRGTEVVVRLPRVTH